MDPGLWLQRSFVSSLEKARVLCRELGLVFQGPQRAQYNLCLLLAQSDCLPVTMIALAESSPVLDDIELTIVATSRFQCRRTSCGILCRVSQDLPFSRDQDID